MQKVIVFELRLGLEHLGPLPESILVIYPTRAPTETGPSWDPHAHGDLSRALGCLRTLTRHAKMRRIDLLSWLHEAAAFERHSELLRLVLWLPPAPAASALPLPHGIR